MYAEINTYMQEIIDELGEKSSPYIFPVLKKWMGEEQRHKSFKTWQRNTNRSLSNMAKNLGGVSLNLYAARHTYANKMVLAGAETFFISKGMGHSRLSTTENYLGGIPAKMRNKHANALIDFVNTSQTHLKAV